MARGQSIAFAFPSMTEEQLRRERLRAFWSASAVALGPYVVGVAWRISDGLDLSVIYLGIPDLALAGVVIAIAAYSNTLLSFTKLDGWAGIGKWTVATAAAVAVMALISMVQYFKAAYTPPTEHKISLLF